MPRPLISRAANQNSYISAEEPFLSFGSTVDPTDG